MHCSRNSTAGAASVLFGKRRASLEPYVARLEIGCLTLCLFASNLIALLYSTALSLGNLAIVIRQLAPFSRGYVDKRFLASLHLVGIHFGAFFHLLHRVVGTEQRPWEFPPDV